MQKGDAIYSFVLKDNRDHYRRFILSSWRLSYCSKKCPGNKSRHPLYQRPPYRNPAVKESEELQKVKQPKEPWLTYDSLV